jgi:hypothetical protein
LATAGLDTRLFRGERAISPLDGSVSWVVIRSAYNLHPESCEYLESLRAVDVSLNTERIYAGRIALYLSYCAERGIDWTRPTLWQLKTFLHWLVEEPLPPRGRIAPAEPRHREEKTASAVVSTTGRFLDFCSTRGWVPLDVVSMLWEPKFLRTPPPGYDLGEDGQFGSVQGRTVKFRIAIEGSRMTRSRRSSAYPQCPRPVPGDAAGGHRCPHRRGAGTAAGGPALPGELPLAGLPRGRTARSHPAPLEQVVSLLVVQPINVRVCAGGVRLPGFRSLPDRWATMQFSL